MNKGHQIVTDYLIEYLNNNNLDKLSSVLGEGAPLARYEKYVLSIENQIAEIKENICIAVWYIQDFLQTYEEKLYNKIFVGRYDFDEEDKEEFVVICINNQFIKCIYNRDVCDLILVEPKTIEYGKIDINWFNSQLLNNFHSDVAEVLNEIKNHIEPLNWRQSIKQSWVELESTP
jgi:hypothetical protein